MAEGKEYLESKDFKNFSELENEIIKFTDAIQAAELESEFSKPNSITDFSILILDNNSAICLTLTKYLHKLGFKNIQYSTTEQQGMYILQNLEKQLKKILVFLDLTLTNNAPAKFISSIFEIEPDIRIIIISAREKNDPIVIDAFANGAYRYLSKPISFADLQKIIEDVKDDELLLGNSSDNIESKIDNVIKNYSQITVAKLADILEEPRSKILSYMEKLETKGKVIQLENKKEVACNKCLAVSLTEILRCPSCKGENFSQGKLIEHYGCGNISFEETYENDICPSCRKKIKAVGLDCKVLPNYFVCNDCNEKSSELLTTYQCDKCGNSFNQDNLKMESSESFKIIPEK